jgi:UDP-perosamine 4-acetyltransferase
MENKLLIIGAGGHARSVLDIALQNDDYSQIECIDSTFPESTRVEGFEEIPIIGNDSNLKSLYNQGYRYIFVALGGNKIRHELYNKVMLLGFEPVNIISRHAVISSRTRLGKGICIMAGATINVNTIINDNCIINTKCSIDHDCHIEESSHIAPGVTISGNVRVGEGAWIGTGTSIIDNISIGKWSFVGGGAAVVKDLEPNALYCGVPAKKIKEL